ncbi:vanadium-dependent haloperoxidase [Rufibacter hautae]|uniref:Vanadium-dependent haloperoxidase n=1 Tax=Rufibacter hautae TaxID=2595005 RepID=A0A5B6T828_9BACT|nr:vanadium-dependent haloperoxidase [Rufibacter hautae]KAA3436336.1 vanadium-dependent haloperoxidase [Rufibacter hautae]
MRFTSFYNSNSALSLLFIFLFSLLSSCNENDDDPEPPTQESADVVFDWYKLILRMQLHGIPPVSGLLNNSNFGYIGVGLYEAVRPGMEGAPSLSTVLHQMPVMPAAQPGKEYMWRASANAALASLTRLFSVNLTDASKASIDSLENAYNQRLQAENTGTAFTESQSFGRSIATAIHEWSKTDNFILSNAGYIPPVFPGAWEPTPASFANAAGPKIKDARPFLASNLTVELPPLPFTYSEDPSSEFYRMAKEVYDASKALTPEQKIIANSWADVGGVGKGYPVPGHTVSIVTDILKERGATLDQAAQIYAKTGIVHRDAIIVLWKMKFHYNLMRPVTYINRFIDPTWQTLVPTPPYPEYPSALAFIVGGVMQVLTREFGDNIPVTDNTYTWNGSAARQFSSFSKIAEEVAISRVYAGIHYKIAVDEGLRLGKILGDKSADLNLGD